MESNHRKAMQGAGLGRVIIQAVYNDLLLVSMRDLIVLIFYKFYNIRFIPHNRLCHRVLQFLDDLHVVVLSDSNMPFRVFTVVVAACQMDDAECAVGIVVGYHASLLES